MSGIKVMDNKFDNIDQALFIKHNIPYVRSTQTFVFQYQLF